MEEMMLLAEFHVGITGTRNGINDIQKENVYRFLKGLSIHYYYRYLHHGDCIGADVQVAEMAYQRGFTIVCHPPEIKDLRGYFKSDIYEKPKSYFARNRDIVNKSDILLVLPYENEHQPTGGTWYTFDYAKKQNKKICIFYPNGTTERLDVLKST
jgi:hypothetical protein